MASEMQQAAVVARTLAGEAAAALRARPQQSQLGIPLSKDLLWGFRRVLVKFGGKKLSQAGQKTFQALPIAYAAVSTKQAKQVNGPERGTRATDSLVKFAIPNFLLLVKEAAHDLDLPLPLDLDEKINYTTLGTGAKPVLTFTQNPGACWTKFGTLKTEYTKGTQAQFDMGPQSEDDFESGKTSEDYMMKLLQYMWTQSTEYKTAAAQDLTGDESGGAATGAGTTVVAAATHSAAAAAATAPGRGAPEAESDGVGPKPTCHCNKDCQIGTFKDVTSGSSRQVWDCADVLDGCDFMVDVEEQRKEDDGATSSSGVGSGSAAGLVTGGNAGTAGGARKMLPEMPEGWLYPHLIMACAWSPWSGNTPSEWKNLCASGGKPEALKEEDKLDTGSNPLSSPAAMAAAASARKMLNNNGDSSSRRQTEAAAKAEADRLRRAQKDKENMALMKETEVTRKKGVAAMEEINVNAVELNKHMKRMVELREDETNLKKDEAQAAKRARKIESLEKRCHMAGGRDAALTSRLHQLLSEESGDA